MSAENIEEMLSRDIEITYNFRLIFLVDGSILPEEVKQNARERKNPILIKKSNEIFTIYGNINGDWRERSLENLNANEHKILIELDFESNSNSFLMSLDIDVNSPLCSVLKKGHDQIDREIELINQQIKSEREKGRIVGQCLGVLLGAGGFGAIAFRLAAPTALASGPAAIVVIAVVGGAIVGYYVGEAIASRIDGPQIRELNSQISQLKDERIKLLTERALRNQRLSQIHKEEQKRQEERFARQEERFARLEARLEQVERGVSIGSNHFAHFSPNRTINIEDTVQMNPATMPNYH